MEGEVVVATPPENQLGQSFRQTLLEVKLCYAKLQQHIEALEQSFQQELDQLSQRDKLGEEVGSGEKSRKLAMNKKKKKGAKVVKVLPHVEEEGPVEETEGQVFESTGSPTEVTDVELEEVSSETPFLPSATTFELEDDSDLHSESSTEKSKTMSSSPTASTLGKATAATPLDRSATATSTAMAKMKTQQGANVDPQVKAFTTEITTEQDEEGMNVRLAMAKQKLESCRKSSNLTLQKVGEFVGAAMGKSPNTEFEDIAIFRWLIFEFFAAMMIVVQSIILGLEVEHLAHNADPSQALLILNLLMTNWFVLEVIIRMRVAGVWEFFSNDQWMWNWTDTLLVIISIFELALTSFGSAGGRSPLTSLKAIKIIRVVRLFRLFRFFPQLARLAMMVADSVRQLLWALVMFMLIMYVWAVTLTDASVDWIKTYVNVSDANVEEQIEKSSTEVQKVHLYFGNLSRGIYTLFQVSLGGISWREVTDAVSVVDTTSFLLLFAYIIFTLLALMNVFTGVFVDNAVQNSKKQRKSQIEEAIDKKRTILDQIVEFFVATDVNGDGTISSDEIQFLLHDPVMSAYFDMIGFRPGDARLLAELLDHDNSGDISLDEFITGCERMRGEAKGIDVHLLMMECYQIHEKLDRLHERTSNFGQRASNPRHNRVSMFATASAQMRKMLSNKSFD